MQATNSKHMSFCVFFKEEGEGVRGTNQLFIYCLLLVCFSFLKHFFCLPETGVISHCAEETTQI